MALLPRVRKMVTQHPHLAICLESIVACCKSHKDSHSEGRQKHGKVLLGTSARPRPVTRVEYDMRVLLCLELFTA